MVKSKDVTALISPRIGRILDAAELCLDERQLGTFRRIVLKEFGEKGLQNDLELLFANSPGKTDRNGMGRND